MNVDTLNDPLVQDYLRELEQATAHLPEQERAELVGEIRAHIHASLGDQPPNEAAVRNVLGSLGSPQQIAAEAGADASSRPSPQARETLTVLALLLGGIVIPILGWFVGLALLWASPAWTTRTKWLATLVVPGGLAFPLLIRLVRYFPFFFFLPPWLEWPLIAVGVLAPIAVAINLLRTAE